MKSALLRIFHHPVFWAFLALTFLAGGLALRGMIAPQEYQGNLIGDSERPFSSTAAPLTVRLADQNASGEVRLIPEEEARPQFLTVNSALVGLPAATGTTPQPPAINCTGPEHTLLLENNSVVLRNVRWRTKNGQFGCGLAIPHKNQTGHFWFFGPENIELTCKALNALGLNQKYWVFCGALTDVEWWMDAINNGNPSIVKQYYNAPGKMASFGDTAALAAGENRPPIFGQCGTTFETPPGRNLLVNAGVNDADGNPVSARLRFISGTNGLNITRDQITLPGGNGEAIFEVNSNVLGTSLVGIEINDGKTMISPLCTVKVIVK